GARLAAYADGARLAAYADGGRGTGIVAGVVPESANGIPAGPAATLVDPVDVAQRWVRGEHVALASWSENAARRVHLPGYQFARERCWFSADEPVPIPPVPIPPVPIPPVPIPPPAAPAAGRQHAEDYLKRLLASHSRLDVDRIRTRVPLQDFGIDSVLINR